MSNCGQISKDSLVLRRQAHCELVEQLAQLEKLREKLRAAERKAAMRASKHAAFAIRRTAARTRLGERTFDAQRMEL